MTINRTHTSKVIFIQFRDGDYWEEWLLRFNRGNKQNNPVKFFSSRTWRSDASITLCPFSSMSFDCKSEKIAEANFAVEIRAIDGDVIQSTQRIVKELHDKFGYEPVSSERKGWV